MHVPKHLLPDATPTACFLINRIPSSVPKCDTMFQILFLNKVMLPIKPWIIGCTCFVQDVHHLVTLEFKRGINVIVLIGCSSLVSKLDPKSLKYIFLGYSRVEKGYQCYCSTLRKYLVSIDVTFLEKVPFSQSPSHTRKRDDDNLHICTIASPNPTHVPALMKQGSTNMVERWSVCVSDTWTCEHTPDTSQTCHMARRWLDKNPSLRTWLRFSWDTIGYNWNTIRTWLHIFHRFFSFFWSFKIKIFF